MYEVGSFQNVFAAAPLRTHLNDTVVLPAGFQHRPAFIDGFGEGFFDINILARLTRQHGRQRVPMIGGGNQNHVDIPAIQNAPEVFDRVRLLAPLALANLDPFRDHRIVYVAYDDAIDLGIEEEAFQVTASHPAGTD